MGEVKKSSNAADEEESQGKRILVTVSTDILIDDKLHLPKK